MDVDHIKDLVCQKGKKYILKPASGFMGGANFLIDDSVNMADVERQAKRELKKFGDLYSNIFSKEMILEEYIEGDEEYAVDMYYNADGYPVILSVYAHPTATNKQYVQLLYYQSREIYRVNMSEFTDFFVALNKSAGLKNFPLHAEFKRDRATNVLMPIEINPCRFAGMGLVDLNDYAFGINIIQSYFDSASIDWRPLWGDSEAVNCWMAAYNDAASEDTPFIPNHQALKQFILENFRLLEYIELDHNRFPVFLNFILKGR